MIIGRCGESDPAMRAAATAGGPARVLRAGALPGPVPATTHAGASDVGDALAVLYRAHYPALVRLAVLLVGDGVTAQDIVQDSFAAMNAITTWDTGKALSTLQASVVHRSRSAPRRHVPAQMAAPASGLPTAGNRDIALIADSAVVAALRALPGLQREVVALRCYCDLSDAQIAAAMGISARAVRRHASRAMAALRPALERET